MSGKRAIGYLGLSIEGKSAKMVLLKNSANKATVIQQTERAFTAVESLTETLEEIISSAGISKYKKHIYANCSVSELLVKQQVISLPLQMSKKDIQVHLQLNIQEYFPQSEEALVYDFKTIPIDDKQQVIIKALPQQQVDDYVNLGKQIKLKFVCLESMGLSLWRALQFLSDIKESSMIIYVCSDHLLFLQGKQSILVQQQVVLLNQSISLLNNIIEFISAEQRSFQDYVLVGNDETLVELSNQLAKHYFVEGYNFTVFEHPTKQYLAAFGAAIRGF